MIDLERALRHLAWGDDWLFARLGEYPEEALGATYAPEAWPVGRLAFHIVQGAEWYAYCLTGRPWTDLPRATSHEALAQLRASLASLDALLLEQAALPDGTVEFEDEDGMGTALRSTILTQAYLHSIEHRAQIACALEASGYPRLDLDSIDLWAFERAGV